jgi:tetratricopeptide (TPR) repeat protein
MQQHNEGGANYQTKTGENNTNYIGCTIPVPSEETRSVRKILMLSANPSQPEMPRRRKEIHKIRKALQRANRSLFVLDDRPEISAADLSQELSINKPYIIDISGHKNGINGLVLGSSSSTNNSIISDRIVAEIFTMHSNYLECIILNGCSSEEQTKELLRHINFVVCISQDIEDKEIIDFLDEFYFQIGTERIQLLPRLFDRNKEDRENKLREKLNLCNNELAKAGNNVNLWRKKAELLKNLELFEEENNIYEILSKLDPSNYKIRTEQGDSLERLGKHEEALTAYTKALELEERNYKIWWKKGKTFANLERYFEAQNPYEYALSLEPPSPDNYVIYREYGFVLKKLGYFQKSLALYKKSLALEPRYRASAYEKKQIYNKIIHYK